MAESNLKINITGDSSKLKNALSSASSKLQAFGGKMQSVGKSMTTSLTLPLVAAGTAATKLALDFNKSMTQIESLVGIANDKVKEMGETAKTMATATGRSANEAAEALFFITSAGLRGADATDTLNASLKAAAVGLGETKVIADLATSAMNAYGVENLNATGATDILVASVREGKLEASELAGAMGGVIPIASNMGVGFHEVGAALAAMSRTGTNAAVGATQLTAILASLKKPTQQSAEAMLALGTSQEEIAKSLAQKGLMPTLMDLSARLKATGTDATAIFPNIRALKGVLDLTGKGAEDNLKIFDALSNTLGATDEAFQKTSESASFKFDQGMATVKNSLLELGKIVLPAVVKAVTKLSEFVKDMSDRFQNLSPETQNFILTLTAILGAAGPLLIIFGKLMAGISALGPILTMAATGFRVLTMAMAANPIIAIASAIALVVVALNQYTKAQKEATAASVADLDLKGVNERLKAAEEELAYMDTLEYKRRYSIGTQKSRNKSLTNEIALLKERKKALEEQAKAENQEIEAQTQQADSGSEMQSLLEKYKNLNKNIVQNDEEAAEKRKKIKEEIDKAIITTDRESYIARKAEAEKHYNNLIKNVEEGSELEKQLIQAKNNTLAQIESDEQSRILEIKQKFADITNASEEEQNALEIERIRQQFAELRQLAIDNNLMTAEQQKAFDAAQAEAEAEVYEEKKVRFLGFMVSQQEALELMQNIGGQIDASFSAIGNSIMQMFGGAQSATGAFVGVLAKDALKILAHNLKISLAGGTAAATETAKSFGPAAAFVLPALIAGATALISGTFAKFAAGGIVSGPTMGLVGEYPGARQNPEVIAPLNKLQSMIGGGNQNINVGGQIRLEGQDLLIAIQRANETADRLF